MIAGGKYFLVDADISAFTNDQVKEYGMIKITDTQLIDDLSKTDYDVWEGEVRRLTTGPNPWSEPLTGMELQSWLRGAKYISKLVAADTINAQFQTVASTETPLEQSSWDQQLQEANALLADPNASAPLIEVLASMRNITPYAYASNVVSAYAKYITDRNRLLADLKSAYQTIDEKTDPVELKNLGWI